MKVKTYLTVSALCLMNISPALAFDLSGSGTTEMFRAIYGTVLSDLIVSDKMRIASLFTCVSDGKFMVSGAAVPEEESEYRPTIIAEIVAGSEVAITISVAHMSKPNRQHASLGVLSCEIFGITDLYPIKSVNGFETLDGYLKSDFFTKLPKPESQ